MMGAPATDNIEDDQDFDLLLREISDLRMTSEGVNRSLSPVKANEPGPMYINFSGLDMPQDAHAPANGPWQLPVPGMVTPPAPGMVTPPPGLGAFAGKGKADPGTPSTSTQTACEVSTAENLSASEDENGSRRTGSGGSGGDQDEDQVEAEDPDLFRTLRLRGLPYRSREEDVRRFLGPHIRNVAQDGQAVRFITNSDGRPSGFATVRFVSHAAAKSALRELHMKRLDSRYIEVFGLRERGHSRQRHDAASGASGEKRAREAAMEPQRDQAVRECVAFMSAPNRQHVLLSMLGVALSDESRTFLKRHALGLKSFLAELDDLFQIEGPKGAERVIYIGGQDGNGPPGLTSQFNADSPQWTPGSDFTPPSMRLELSNFLPLVGTEPGAQGLFPDASGGAPGLFSESGGAPGLFSPMDGMPLPEGMDSSEAWGGQPWQWPVQGFGMNGNSWDAPVGCM